MSLNAKLNSSTASTRLNGKHLLLARLAWWGIAILTFVYAIATMIYRSGDTPFTFLEEREIILLKQIGVSPDFYVIYFNTILSITALFFSLPVM